MTITVTGFPASDPIPAVKLNVLLGQGTRSPGSGPRSCIVVGHRAYADSGDAVGGAAQGTATSDQIYQVYSAEDAAGYWGRGSNLHRSVKAALDTWRGLTVYGISCGRGGVGGGVQATHGVATTTLGGGPTATAGTITIYIGDATAITVTPTVGDAVDTVGAAIAAALDAATNLPTYHAYDAGTNVLSIWAKSPGQDSTGIKYRIDAGTTGITFDGAATDSGNLAAGTDGTSGAGPTEVWTTTCDVIQASDIRFTYVLPCCLESSNAMTAIQSLLEDSCTSDYGRRMHAVIGHNGTSAQALSVADGIDDGTVDVDNGAFRTQLAWASYNEAQPWEIAAAVLGLRAEAESSNVNANWIGFSGATIPVSAGLHKCVSSSNYPTEAQFTSCLNAGVTPIKYNTDDDTLTIVRSITCKWETPEGTPDYRARDTNIPATTDYVAAGLIASLQDEYDGFTIADDDADGNPPDNLASYVTTPSLIRSTIYRLLKVDYEDPGYICNVDDHEDSLVVERNATNSQRVDCEIPIEVVRHLYQIGGNVREVGQ